MSQATFSPYTHFSREAWSALRATTPLTLSKDDIDELRGLNEALSLDEVAEVYLPLSRLLNLYVAKAQELFQVTDAFLGKPAQKVPFVIGMAGSVAVGKSTTARVLQALLSHWPDHPRVALVTTDGFLLPNRVLEARDLMSRKGFPESYDQRRLLQFLIDIKSGAEIVNAPRLFPPELRRHSGRTGANSSARHRDFRGAQRLAAQRRPRQRHARLRLGLFRFFDLCGR